MIPISRPTLTGKEFAYIKDCLNTKWIGGIGKYITQFEKQFADYCDCKYGVTTTSGTTALHLALASIGLKKGDEIIIPTFTMIASAKAALYTGAKPVLVDVDPTTYNLDPKLIEEKITDNTKGIMPVHLYGHPCDMNPIINLAKKHELKVIQDNAEAVGALYNNNKVSSLGDAACFSFYANKIITTGEGGMIATNNKSLAKKAQLLKNLAFTEPRFYHHEFGFNYRMTNIQAAIGLAQLKAVDTFIRAHRNNAKLYNELLKDVPGITLPTEKQYAKNVYCMYTILIEEDFGMAKEVLMRQLRTKGIDTRSFFLPLHQQPLFKQKHESYPDISGTYPIADTLFNKGICLPFANDLTEEEIHRVVDAIKSLQN